MIVLLLQSVPNPADPLAGGDPWWGYVKVLLLLGAVLCLAYGGVRFVLPKLGPWKNIQSGPVSVVARFLLEPRRTIYVLKAGEQFILLASSESGVSVLTELDPSGWREGAQSK